jgi:hypothetical protein
MKALFAFALALFATGRPYLGVILVFAVATRLVGPIRFTLSIGDRACDRGRQHPAGCVVLSRSARKTGPLTKTP